MSEYELGNRLTKQISKLQAEVKRLKEDNERYLKMMKLFYRKHHIGDESVGWEELGDMLCNTLCNILGDDGFQKWLQSLKGE